MKYISTRGEAAKLNFKETFLAGLAADGGLYVPETYPFFQLIKSQLSKIYLTPSYVMKFSYLLLAKKYPLKNSKN